MQGNNNYSPPYSCTPGGIGYALATEFQNRGFHVIATARKKSVLETLREKGMSAVRLEMTDEASITACRDEVGKLVDGELDILVNNAGRGLTLPATDTPLPTARLIYETNLFGPISLTTALLPLLLPTHGLIINLASISALIPYIFGSIYASSKAALASYTRTLRLELAPLGVRVMLVMAGAVETNIGHVPENELPEESLYSPVRKVWERRLAFSQTREAGPMEVGRFARRLVQVVGRGEVGAFWRACGWGRPDVWFEGGQAGWVYWASWMPEWVVEWGVWRKFRLWELEAVGKEGEEEEGGRKMR
ncbi:MAG: hypothetical protein Q9184_000259 [Pyrenodesmia sp. 2 TL-2023]